MEGQPFLENLAVTPRGLAELQRRGAGGPAERAHEIGEVGEADVKTLIEERLTTYVESKPLRLVAPFPPGGPADIKIKAVD